MARSMWGETMVGIRNQPDLVSKIIALGLSVGMKVKIKYHDPEVFAPDNLVFSSGRSSFSLPSDHLLEHAHNSQEFADMTELFNQVVLVSALKSICKSVGFKDEEITQLVGRVAEGSFNEVRSAVLRKHSSKIIKSMDRYIKTQEKTMKKMGVMQDALNYGWKYFDMRLVRAYTQENNEAIKSLVEYQNKHNTSSQEK